MKLIYPAEWVLRDDSIEGKGKEYIITSKTELKMYGHNNDVKDLVDYWTRTGIILQMDGKSMREYSGKNNTGL
jgi:hypothetical protein